LTVAALVPYKRVEVAVEVAKRLGRRIEVVGTGPQQGQLRRLAGDHVTFRGWLSRDDLREAYRHAAALVVPNIEDFGMVTVEALACGTPVVGLASSGISDVVRSGQEGELADENSVEALTDATDRLLQQRWDERGLRQRTDVFSRSAFQMRFRFLLDRLEFGRVLE
jgi:glycosyltransferase involved in cell wall biosynthesis